MLYGNFDKHSKYFDYFHANHLLQKTQLLIKLAFAMNFFEISLEIKIPLMNFADQTFLVNLEQCLVAISNSVSKSVIYSFIDHGSSFASISQIREVENLMLFPSEVKLH